MRSLEKGYLRESLEDAISRIGFAYGFKTPPVVISKKAASDAHKDAPIGAALALLKTAPQATAGPLQLWGTSKTQTGTVVSLAVVGTKHAIGNALVLKTALSIAELSGFSDFHILVSSAGDAESRKRFTRELTNFFKKQLDELPEEMRSDALRDPDSAYRALLEKKDPLLERAPRAIDYLSENSRKLMLDTLSFFEAVGIPYTIDPRLHGEPGVHTELLFAIEVTDKNGERVRIAEGGRYDEIKQKAGDADSEHRVAMSVLLPKKVVLEEVREAPQCFVVHVGDAAKIQSFTLLEALWRAHIAVTNALMGENLRAQIDLGKKSGTKYIAIIGQREALDGTVIVRNTSTQLQTTIPLGKLEAYLARGAR